MANILKFQTDKTKEKEGVWVEVGEGLEVKVARIGNPAYEAYLTEIGKPLRIAGGRAQDPAVMKVIIIKAIARHVLVDWKNFEEPDEKGDLQPVVYSELRAIQYMTDMNDFYRMIMELGTDRTLFTGDADKGNSSGS